MNFDAIGQYFILLFPALRFTLGLTAGGIALGLILGLATAFMKLSKLKIFTIPANMYTTVIRGTPLLVQMFFAYFVIAPYFGWDEMTAGIVALAAHNGAYMAEIIRGGIQSINIGQLEAALSLGMNTRQAMKRIILPQAFKRIIPALANQFIIALKDSSLASVIAVNELVQTGRYITARTFEQLEVWSVVAVYYLVLTTIFTLLVNKLELKLSVSERS